MSDLLDILADLDRADVADSITPGTRLRMLGHYGWPVAVLTVEAVSPGGDVITTTSDHPGPAWSSYDRDWYGWWVREHMAVIS